MRVLDRICGLSAHHWYHRPGATKTFHWSPKSEITAIESWPYSGLANLEATELVEDKMPTIIDVNAEAAKLTMFRGKTPKTTRAERKGSSTQLGVYRDGLLLLGKSSGMSHWETHPEDELIYVLDGSVVLDIVEDDGPPRSFTIGAGMMVIVPPGAWHRFHSADGATTMSAVIPGENIDLDVDDPRQVELKPA